MREIKFRAWDKKKKIMLQNIESCYDQGSVDDDFLFDEQYFGAFVGRNTRHDRHNAKRYDVMQFTGLKDKNGKGKEIYEGDIVQWILKNDSGGFEVNYIGEIVWNEFNAGFGFEAKGGTREMRNVAQLILEVIGNVHETPELLKK